MSVFNIFKKSKTQKKQFAYFYEKWEKNGRYYIRFKTEDEQILDFEVMHEVFVELKAGLAGKLTYDGDKLVKFKWEK